MSKEEMSDKTHGSKESKTESKAAFLGGLQESLHLSMCIARSSAAGGSQKDVGKVPCTHRSHKKSKKHGKSSYKKLCH